MKKDHVTTDEAAFTEDVASGFVMLSSQEKGSSPAPLLAAALHSIQLSEVCVLCLDVVEPRKMK